MYFQLPHKHKVVIAGNHELCFDPSLSKAPGIVARSGHIGTSPSNQEESHLASDKAAKCQDIKKELTNCTYLEDSSVEICGLKVYGKYLPSYSSYIRRQTPNNELMIFKGAGVEKLVSLPSVTCRVK